MQLAGMPSIDNYYACMPKGTHWSDLSLGLGYTAKGTRP